MSGRRAAQGEFVHARTLFDDSVRRFHDLGDEGFAILAAYNLAVVIGSLGDEEG